MASIFSQDNPFNDFMSTVGDMAMISIAWTICSIPVVTVGASTAAACEVARELQSGSCKGIFRSFWAAFKRRFPTTLALTAAIAAFCGLALFDLWYLSRQSTDTVAVLYGVTIVVIAVVGSALAFVLPLTGRSKLSVGEQQRVEIARAIAHKPKIIFADEPTAELDTATGLQVMKIFKELIEKEEVTIVMTTHDMGLLDIADCIYHLEDGEIVDEK